MAIASSSWLTIGPPLPSGYESSIPLPVNCKETVKVLLRIRENYIGSPPFAHR